MTEHANSRSNDFETILHEQPQRIIAALEEQEPVDATPILHDDEDLTSEKYVTLVYELHHVHLPALLEAGLVAFDPEQDKVRRGARFGGRRLLQSPDME